jgi:hypothetical protein
MRKLNAIHAMIAAAALSTLAGCAGSSALAPKSLRVQGRESVLARQVPAPVGVIAALRLNPSNAHPYVSFDTCPATGAITYISDYNNNVINIYAGRFKHQMPCGAISGSPVHEPEGLFVGLNHRLYVANTGGGNILEFTRGGSTPIATFTDPTGEFPSDVAVANDAVIASNISSVSQGGGSISTWHIGGGFVGNFPMINDIQGLFVTVQSGAADRIYYNDIDATSNAGVVYTGKCPAGACGAFAALPATTNTVYPGGLRSRSLDTHLIQFDQTAGPGGVRLRYDDNNPSFPTDPSCNIGGSHPIGFDMNSTASQVYYADAVANVGGEMVFGSCKSIGTVPGNPGGLLVGVAHDPPEPL